MLPVTLKGENRNTRYLNLEIFLSPWFSSSFWHLLVAFIELFCGDGEILSLNSRHCGSCWVTNTFNCWELRGRNIRYFIHYVKLLLLMYFRCIAQSQCVLKVLILRGAVPVDMHTTAFLLTHFLFFMFLVQCLKLTYVCLCMSFFVSANADISTSQSDTLPWLGRCICYGGNHFSL